MGEIDKLAVNIQRNIDGVRQSEVRFVECTAVDWESKTMDATGASDGAEYWEVSLGLGAVYIKPVVGCTCLIGLIEGQEVATFLIHAGEVELMEIEATQIVFNEGKNEGFVKVAALTTRLNNIEKAFNSFLTEYKAHNHTHLQGATTGFVMPPTTASISVTNQKDIENDKITH